MKKIKKHKHLISAYIVSFFAVAFTLIVAGSIGKKDINECILKTNLDYL